MQVIFEFRKDEPSSKIKDFVDYYRHSLHRLITVFNFWDFLLDVCIDIKDLYTICYKGLISFLM